MTSQRDGSFNILGSAMLNTPNGQNPPTSSSTTETTETNVGATKQAADADSKQTACQKAHDELEARLRDEELGARSKGW